MGNELKAKIEGLQSRIAQLAGEREGASSKVKGQKTKAIKKAEAELGRAQRELAAHEESR